MEDVTLLTGLQSLGGASAAVAVVYYMFTRKIDTTLKAVLDEWRDVRTVQERQVDRLLSILEKKGAQE